MPYSQELAARVRRALAGRDDVEEKRMVGGGLSFMVGGRMCCGVTRDALMVRVGVDAAPAALAEPHVAPMTLGGRQLDGYVLVSPEGHAGDDALGNWLGRGLAGAGRS
ncbi:TfoX/Sxy family protein [Trujillonella humicola]|uniref:TfoX/Sxy family protein n=1 Tax=Trujillonella humicola TaxID=3383699 RepID=UPI003906A49F